MKKRTGRPPGTIQSPEARAKIAATMAAKWKDPEYRAANLWTVLNATAAFVEKHPKRKRKPRGGVPGRPPGTPQSAEAKEKIRQAMIKRWQDPEIRAHYLPIVLRSQPLATEVSARVRRVVPRGTPERRLYNKIAAILGPAAARSLQLTAETEGAGS